jgi:hypothetical protein
VTFAALQSLLRDLRFSRLVGEGGYVVNDHAGTGCRLLYPAYAEDHAVPLFHLVATQRFLDEFGILDADDFRDQVRKHAVAG